MFFFLSFFLSYLLTYLLTFLLIYLLTFLPSPSLPSLQYFFGSSKRYIAQTNVTKRGFRKTHDAYTLTKTVKIYTECPTRYRTRYFFNNFNTNEDIATKFEQEYIRCVRNEEECVCSSLQISFQYSHSC